MAELVRDLGTLLAVSDGDGRYAPGTRRTLPLRIVATVDAEGIERDADGAVTFAAATLMATYEPRHWHADDGRGDVALPYTDGGIERAVGEHLARLGFSGWVGWSELGRQAPGQCDFDMDCGLVDQLWPELAPGNSRRP